MKIEVYLDGRSTPLTVIEPPETFKLDTTKLEDGRHTLVLKAIDENGATSVREMQFAVRNGPGIAVHGLRDGDLVAGEISVLANAYSSRVGDIFEPMRIETPAPIPTWAWLLFLVVFAWGMWYLGMTYKEHEARLVELASPLSGAGEATPAGAPSDASRGLGKQVYETNCAACHQIGAEGLPGVFPPLKNSAVVTAADPSDHVLTVLNGLQGKAIDGISYAAPMPPLGTLLNDEEVAAVVNYERTSWGHDAPPVTPQQVRELRN
jgi:mono/diheme cytochrome c family protein